MDSRPISILGLGAVCALGESPDLIFDRICAGECAITSMWEGVGPTARIPGSPTAAALALSAATHAMANYAGRRERLAVVGASTAGEMALGEAAYRQHTVGEAIEHPEHFLWKQLCHNPTQEAARILGARGPVLTASTACTSGALAIAIGADLLRADRADAVLVLGVDTLCSTTAHGFSSLSLHSADGCHPFDINRSGMCLGEGAAALLLGRSPSQLQLLGWANASDAHHMSTPHPDGRGARQSIQRAMTMAQRRPQYVNAHGTGTELNDAAEARLLADLGLPISGVKGAIGHTLGAAGTLEAVITLMALERGIAPPTVGLTNPAFDLDLLQGPREIPLTCALSVNLAFGGHNTALIFGSSP